MMTSDWSKNSWKQKQGSGSDSKSEYMVEVKVMCINDMEWIGIDVMHKKNLWRRRLNYAEKKNVWRKGLKYADLNIRKGVLLFSKWGC